jgi:septal ring factor EnvC (AmiA/AmiB activator)
VLKRQQEEEQARKEEEDALLDLLLAEMEAERARAAAQERRQRQEAARRDMAEANEGQKRFKVGEGLECEVVGLVEGGAGCTGCLTVSLVPPAQPKRCKALG